MSNLSERPLTQLVRDPPYEILVFLTLSFSLAKRDVLTEQDQVNNADSAIIFLINHCQDCQSG